VQDGGQQAFIWLEDATGAENITLGVGAPRLFGKKHCYKIMNAC